MPPPKFWDNVCEIRARDITRLFLSIAILQQGILSSELAITVCVRLYYVHP